MSKQNLQSNFTAMNNSREVHKSDISNFNKIPNDVLNDTIQEIIILKRSRTFYLGKITQNINKINYYISLKNKLNEIKECLYKLESTCIKSKPYLKK